MKRPLKISIDDALKQRLQEYADENGLSLSGAISVLVNQQLKQEDALLAAKDIASIWDKIRRIKDIDSIDVVPASDPGIDIDWKK